MKKIVALVIFVLLLFGMIVSGCSNNQLDTQSSSRATEKTSQENEIFENTEYGESEIEEETEYIENVDGSSQDTDNEQIEETIPNELIDPLPELNTNASIQETILVDENDIIITATSLNFENWSVDLNLRIENKGEKNLTVLAGTAGYCQNFINDFMFSDGYFNADVEPGQTVEESISFSNSEIRLVGIYDILEIGIGFEIKDDNYNYVYLEPRVVKTSLSDSQKTNISENHYLQTVISKEAQNEFDYKVLHASADRLFEQDGIIVDSECLLVRDESSVLLLMDIINNSEEPRYVTLSDIMLNNINICWGSWTGDWVSPGKHALLTVDYSDLFNERYWEAFGINTFESTRMILSVEDEDYKTITDSEEIYIVVSNDTGTEPPKKIEIYSGDGIKIYYVGFVTDDRSYINDLYALMLIENNSGKDISVDDEYNSVSVNDIPTSYRFSGIEVKDGEVGRLMIRLNDDSLEENGIISAENVEYISIDLELMDVNGEEEVIKLTIEP